MIDMNCLSAAQELLEQLPGVIGLKSVGAQESHFVWANQSVAELFGYKHRNDLIGARDQDLPCDAADNAQAFHLHDCAALANKSIKTLDIYQYSHHHLVGVLIVKKCYRIMQDDYVCFNGHILSPTELKLFVKLASDSCGTSILKKGDTYQFTSRYDELNLSARESEVYFYYLRGKCHKEIAYVLNISTRTVEKHVTAIKEKTGVMSRSALYDLAYEQGILNVIPHNLIAAE